MKTPDRIAERIRFNNGHALNDSPRVHGAELQRLMVAAIEADRAQRENDGTVHAAVIDALTDRASQTEDTDERGAINAGAQWIEDEPDEFWEEFAGPMLDEIERKFA